MHAILQTCIQVEERAGAIYAELANHPGADEELREIWQAMADDEARHAGRIRMVGDRLEMAGLRETGLDAAEVQGLLDRAGEILQDVQEGQLSVDEAVFLSVELEDAFLKAHLNYGDVEGHPDLQTMFRALAEEDLKHTTRLKAYIKRMHDGAGLTFEEPGDA